ncbi:hypothetical protein [Synechococcus sp. PCC 7336]|uniref:hypothetical protein n=1 Tax=Synechococcus sp. PCC 7336 TaxID=195250 RepID=UPI000345090E|nr:hypothetical protein [Synechococcus sp. PCC 7336]
MRYLSKAEAIAQAEREQSRMVEEIAALAHDKGVRELEGAIALLLREWGGEAGICEVAEGVAGGRAIAVLLVVLSSELILVFGSESFHLSLDCLRIQLQQELRCEAL